MVHYFAINVYVCKRYSHTAFLVCFRVHYYNLWNSIDDNQITTLPIYLSLCLPCGPASPLTSCILPPGWQPWWCSRHTQQQWWWCWQQWLWRLAQPPPSCPWHRTWPRLPHPPPTPTPPPWPSTCPSAASFALLPRLSTVWPLCGGPTCLLKFWCVLGYRGVI